MHETDWGGLWQTQKQTYFSQTQQQSSTYTCANCTLSLSSLCFSPDKKSLISANAVNRVRHQVITSPESLSAIEQFSNCFTNFPSTFLAKPMFLLTLNVWSVDIGVDIILLKELLYNSFFRSKSLRKRCIMLSLLGQLKRTLSLLKGGWSSLLPFLHGPSSSADFKLWRQYSLKFRNTIPLAVCRKFNPCSTWLFT